MSTPAERGEPNLNRATSEIAWQTPPGFYNLPTWFYLDGKQIWGEIDGVMWLHRGDGVVDGDGTRYRLADVWWSFDHHGPFDDGMHIMLEPAEADDPLGQMAPDYFRP
jgi:hypothetical protein